MIQNDDYDADEILREDEEFIDDEDFNDEEEEPIEELDFENGNPNRYNEIVSDIENEEDLLE
ncbi:MAG: hypothetical protein GF350_01470 [Chitinivibrionales bacterium]|nr:hypothetical protein [Chitinivibrionales bacterium]